MLILSTTNQMLNLSQEIASLLTDECNEFRLFIAEKKIKQLSRLTRSSTLLYLSAGCFVFSGILQVITQASTYSFLPSNLLYLGAVLVLVGLGILISYSYHTITIRKLQHTRRGEMLGKGKNSL
ncbi:hypothetical protein GCM10007049_11820 [Echinicola pacifica]|uniref:Uncharacterized protein n=2 Tax=Echinicola pacifica TaxID=346377 RepID=A0A918PRP2_9BACT|nr:hypothetical protein GCM10007049_11820 [Echinicola pacifica]